MEVVGRKKAAGTWEHKSRLTVSALACIISSLDSFLLSDCFKTSLSLQSHLYAITMKLNIYQVDAFTSKVFGGNPAAIIPLESWLPDDLLQNLALENNLSETAFFVKTEGGTYHLRWFTPTVEVDLCGHATLATAHVMWKHIGFTGAEITFQSRSGELSVKRKGNFYELNFPTDHLEKSAVSEIMVNALGIFPSECYQGREDYLLIFENQQLVEKLKPDFTILRKLKTRGILASAPGNDVDFVSRCFFPAYGVDEDPVTGSAHTTLTPYWAARLKKQELTAKQISKRGGLLHCILKGERTHIKGQAITYMQGQIEI